MADELDDLLTRWSLGLLTGDETGRLDALLRDSPAARSLLRRHAALDEALATSLANPLIAAWNPPADAPQRQPAFGYARAGAWIGAAAAVACGLIAAALVMRPAARGVPEPTESEQHVEAHCALLAQAIDARWAPGAAALTIGAGLSAETLHLTRGVARLEFYSGASVTLEGDTAIELHSAWEARLTHGKARVHVPPAARGFTLLTLQGKLVDLGTEYGLDVSPDGAATELHVFDGEVELHRPGAAAQSVRGGQAVLAEAARVSPLSAAANERFPDAQRLDALGRDRDAARSADWWAGGETLRRDPRLVAFFPFRRAEGEWSRNLLNYAEPVNKDLHGGIVGAGWSEGRWRGKDALEFKRPGDRVRLSIPGELQAVSIACWARIDSLDRKYNALLLTDGYDHGEIHWQIYEDGRLMFSIQTGEQSPGRQHNEIVYSDPFFTTARSGQWFHLAVSYDNASGEVCQYVNGEPMGRTRATDHRPARCVAFGASEIGNWGLPTLGHQHPVRNLNGRIDEFALWSAALSPGEIARLYEQGKPD